MKIIYESKVNQKQWSPSYTAAPFFFWWHVTWLYYGACYSGKFFCSITPCFHCLCCWCPISRLFGAAPWCTTWPTKCKGWWTWNTQCSHPPEYNRVHLCMNTHMWCTSLSGCNVHSSIWCRAEVHPYKPTLLSFQFDSGYRCRPDNSTEAPYDWSPMIDCSHQTLKAYTAMVSASSKSSSSVKILSTPPSPTLPGPMEALSMVLLLLKTPVKVMSSIRSDFNSHLRYTSSSKSFRL